MEVSVAVFGKVSSVGREHERNDDPLTGASWLWRRKLESVMGFDERRRCVDLSMHSDWLRRVCFPEEFVRLEMEMRED